MSSVDMQLMKLKKKLKMILNKENAIIFKMKLKNDGLLINRYVLAYMYIESLKQGSLVQKVHGQHVHQGPVVRKLNLALSTE